MESNETGLPIYFSTIGLNFFREGTFNPSVTTPRADSNPRGLTAF